MKDHCSTGNHSGVQKALDTAMHYCTEERYWSSHRVLGDGHDDHGAGFITTI